MTKLLKRSMEFSLDRYLSTLINSLVVVSVFFILVLSQ